MASSDLRAELDCSICLNIYKDPVMLKCGHNFCRVCIERVFDTQEECGDYFCPQCRDEFQERPPLHINITLRNITQRFQSAPPDPEKTDISCTYCIHTSVPAVKSCLLCEASLCEDHLRVHSKSPEHILCDPTTTLENRKCSVHKKILELYCTEDSTSICISCSLTGDHRGHQVETLQEASMKKKRQLINNLQKWISKRENTEERVRSLQGHRRSVQRKADNKAESFAALFRDLRRRLEDLEKRFVVEITRQTGWILSPVNDMIQQLEFKIEELSQKIRHIEELCAVVDPLTVLQEPETGDLCDTEDGDDEDRERHDQLIYDGGDLDLAGDSLMFRTPMSDMINCIIGFTGGIYIEKAEDMVLDEETAHTDLTISYDRKTVSRSGRVQNRPYTSERFFNSYQVLGNRSFSSGRHYWEVDVQKSNNWRIGMCYDSIDRDDYLVGCDEMSWGLLRRGKEYSIVHDNFYIELPDNIPCGRVRVYLDYEAGQLSFYICDPIRHLHTFTATFTEPLYAVLGVWHSYITLS